MAGVLGFTAVTVHREGEPESRTEEFSGKELGLGGMGIRGVAGRMHEKAGDKDVLGKAGS